MHVAIAIIAFAAMSLLAWEVLRPKQDPVARRIRGERYAPVTSSTRLQGSLARRAFGPTARGIGRKLVDLLPPRLLQGLDRMLVRSNSQLSLPEFMATWAVIAAVGALLLLSIARSNAIVSAMLLFLVAVCIFITFGLGPYMVLRRKVKDRQKSISRSLPYALDLLVTCVEAGLGVEAAIAVVAEKTKGPLSETLVLYLREVGLGRARRAALAHIAERTGVPELARLAASVAQAEEMGTTIGDVLRAQANELRLVRRQRARAAAERAPVMMAIPLTTCFTPALIAVTVVPAFLNMMMNVVGRLGAGPIAP